MTCTVCRGSHPAAAHDVPELALDVVDRAIEHNALEQARYFVQVARWALRRERGRR